MRYGNIDGVVGFRFIIGYGTNGATIQVENGIMKVGRVQSTVPATEDPDLTTLKTVNDQIAASAEILKEYVDQKVQEGGDGSGSGSATIDMLPVYTITPESIVNGNSYQIGSLKANHFIDKVVFELKEAFSSDVNQELYIAVGTANNHAAFGTLQLSKLTKTQVINVCQTLDSDTDVYLFITDRDEGSGAVPSFNQVVFNEHPSVEDTLTSDASYKVWTATFTGSNLLGEITQPDVFGSKAEGNMMDFGVNIPVEEGHTYRIVQQNPALQIYDGADEFVSQVEGVWTKSKTYTIEAGSETELDYYFLLTESSGDSDYIHIYVYDETDPETAIRTYHIHNQLKFEGTSPIASLLQIDYASASEAAVGIVQNADNQYTLTLNGEVTNLGEQVSAEFAGVTGNATKLGIYYAKHIGTQGIRAIIYNPAAQLFTGDESTLQSSGVYYTDVTMTDEDEHDGCWIYFPIVESKTYPIIIAIIDLETKDYVLYGIDNNLTFKQASTANIMMANLFDMANGAVTLADESTGKVLLRIISF